jgi:hypothetical protein
MKTKITAILMTCTSIFICASKPHDKQEKEITVYLNTYGFAKDVSDATKSKVVAHINCPRIKIKGTDTLVSLVPHIYPKFISTQKFSFFTVGLRSSKISDPLNFKIKDIPSDDPMSQTCYLIAQEDIEQPTK